MQPSHIDMKRLAHILIAMIAILTVSCTKEPLLDPMPDADKSTITVSFTAPDIVNTRASAAYETAIASCYLVAFTTDNPTSAEHLRFFEEIATRDIKQVGEDIRKKIINFSRANFESLQTGDKLHLILNPTGTNYTSDGLATAGYNLMDYFKISGNGVIVPTAQKGLPMYGKVTYTKNSQITIDMKSATSKIALNVAPGLDFGFSASNISYEIAQIVDRAHLDGLGTPASTLPYESDIASPPGRFSYSANVHGASDFSNVVYSYAYPYSRYYKSVGSIETPLNAGRFDFRRFCIIIKNSGTTSASYYRLDLHNTTTGVQEYIDLLANTFYKINITGVYNQGYDTAKDALLHPSTNMQFDIVMENPDDNLISNGQYGLKVEEPEPEIRHDYSEHPLRYANIFGVHVATEGPKDLTTVRRVASGDAPLPQSTPLTVELIDITKPAGSYIYVRQRGNTPNNSTVLTTDINSTSDANKKDIEVYFSAHKGEFRYKYKVTLGNIVYQSEVFSFVNQVTSGKYMFNSNERQRYIDLGENLGDLNNYTVEVSFANGQVITESTDQINYRPDTDATSGTNYIITFGKDNATPTHWVTKLPDGRIEVVTDTTGINCAPVFADKYFRLKDNTGKVVLQVVQAAPFYIGRYTDGSFVDGQASGTHMCVASYNGYDNTIPVTPAPNDWRRDPGRGSWFSYADAMTYATTWAGDGLIEQVGWRLPEYKTDGAADEMYSMYDKIFNNTDNRGASVASGYRWWNPNVNFTAEWNTRYNFLPLAANSQFDAHLYGHYWSSSRGIDGGPNSLGTEAAYARRQEGFAENTGMSVRVVRPVR